MGIWTQKLQGNATNHSNVVRSKQEAHCLWYVWFTQAQNKRDTMTARFPERNVNRPVTRSKCLIKMRQEGDTLVIMHLLSQKPASTSVTLKLNCSRFGSIYSIEHVVTSAHICLASLKRACSSARALSAGKPSVLRRACMHAGSLEKLERKLELSTLHQFRSCLHQYPLDLLLRLLAGGIAWQPSTVVLHVHSCSPTCIYIVTANSATTET